MSCRIKFCTKQGNTNTSLDQSGALKRRDRHIIALMLMAHYLLFALTNLIKTGVEKNLASFHTSSLPIPTTSEDIT